MSQNTGIINNPCSSSSPVWHVRVRAINRSIFVWPWKMVSVSVRYYLFCQPINVKIKTWSLRFPAKENPNVEKALFDWPIVLQYDVEAKYRLISRKFFGREAFSLNQTPSRVCIRSLNQSNRSISSISVNLLFLRCSRVFVSRSYENRGASSFLDGSSLNYLPWSKSFKMFFTFSRLIL